MKFALVIRDESYEFNVSPQSVEDQAILQLLYQAAVVEGGEMNMRVAKAISSDLPSRLWLTIRKADDGSGPIPPTVKS